MLFFQPTLGMTLLKLDILLILCLLKFLFFMTKVGIWLQLL